MLFVMHKFDFDNDNLNKEKDYIPSINRVKEEEKNLTSEEEKEEETSKPQLIPRPEYNPNIQVDSLITTTIEINQKFNDNYSQTEHQSSISHKKIRDKISIFVDGNNMFYAQQKNGWFFDPRKVIDYFSEESGFMLINAFWYTGLKRFSRPKRVS